MKREVVATVRLAALRHNLRVVRRHCPRSQVLAMVKSNGYGHGLGPVAEALVDADALGVAVLDEALALRAAGVDKPVVILEGVFSAAELRTAGEHGFGLVAHQREQVELLAHTAVARPLDVWLKLETGMHRLGLPVDAAEAAFAALAPRGHRLGAMTHFASADEPALPITRLQLDRLLAFARRHHLRASAANSAGILTLAASHLDLVRPGIMLYGASPGAGKAAFDFGLRPVMTLSARVLAINDVPAGECVGYGQSWTATRASRIGVIGVGYGDGYPRHAANGTPVRIGGQLVPLAGRVSMDMITVDLTAHPEVKIGDEAVLWGDELSADIVANHAGTISYELFCRLTARVRFVYEH